MLIVLSRYERRTIPEKWAWSTSRDLLNFGDLSYLRNE